MSDVFSPKQERILAFPRSDYDALICYGSVRSGKTSIMSVAFVLWAMTAFNGRNFAICSKTVSTAIKNVVQPLLGMSFITERYDVTFRRSLGELVIERDGRKNTFYIYGGNDERSYQLIQGITLAGVLLDEVALMPRSFVEQALARCSVDGRKFWFNCNPEGSQHWFYQEWILDAERHNAQILHFDLDDNPSLSEKIKNDYRSMYSGVFYQRYILGEWVSAEGLIFDMFDKDIHVGHCDTEGEYYVSSDYGIQNATVFLLWQKEKGTARWHCLREYYYSGRDEKKQKTVAELADGLEDMLDGISPRQIIIDPSAAALIVELRKRGYHTREAVNDVLDGIADVSTLLRRNLLLFAPECKGAINEFGVYSWDPKQADRGIDAPIKTNDHACDAIRYFVKTMKLVRKVDKRTNDNVSGSSGGWWG